MASDTFETLIERVQGLPTELFDATYEYTMSSNSPTAPIHYMSQFPVQLHINSSSREAFATEYYQNTKFTTTDPHSLDAWLKAMPAHHKAQIRRIEISFTGAWTGSTMSGRRNFISTMLKISNGSAFHGLQPGVVFTMYRSVGERSPLYTDVLGENGWAVAPSEVADGM